METYATAAPDQVFSLHDMENAAGILDGLKVLKQLIAFFQGLGITTAELSNLVSLARDLFTSFSAEKLATFIMALLAAMGTQPVANANKAVNWPIVFSIIKMLIEFFTKKPTP